MIDLEKQVPKHIAIIMDGNGRWARQRGKSRIFGHRAGTKATREIVKACGELGVQVLTIYVFSSENWGRPRLEVRSLMQLLIEMVKKEISELNKNNVKLGFIGDIDLLPDVTRKALLEGIEKTSKNTGLTLLLAISYSGRSELVRAFKKMGKDIMEGSLKVDSITETTINHYLDTHNYPDPDLLIRTGGDLRVSNFLLWQIAYTELFVTPKLWPDFTKEESLLRHRVFS
ncbi:MAG: polyprenyl diphosphate synthase [Elusimicrobiota bacterium]